MDLLPFILLAASLLVFLLSTRQWPLLWRSLIWLFGLGLLAASAIVILLGPTSPGVLQALLDLVIRQQGGEVLRTAFEGNFETLGSAIMPMFGVFLVLTLVIAVVSLIAFTPGQTIERLLRPLNTAVLGAIAGALLALVVAGVGFGGLEKRRVFINVVNAEDVVDGDTIRMGDVSIRLWGIDTPEHRTGQMCRHGDAARSLFKCGDDATTALSSLAAGKLVICQAPRPINANARADRPPRETFGRPIMSCWTGAPGDRLYLSAEMARMGYAESFRLDDRDDPSKNQILQALSEAKANRAGIWNGWTISADDWRNNKPCRDWFTSEAWRPATQADSVVACPPFAPLPANDNPPSSRAPAPPPATALPAVKKT